MKPVLGARRRADAFDALVEQALRSDRSRPDDALVSGSAEFAELVPVMASLRAEREVAPRPEFHAALRERLMTAARTELVAAPVPARTVETAPARRRERRVAAALAGFAIVGAGTSMAVAAQSALPGDTLYPLKRAIESAHAGVQSGDDRGDTLLDNASSRLDEVGDLSRSGDQSPQTIAETLQSFSDEAAAGSGALLTQYQEDGRLASLQRLRTFTAQSLTTLQQLSTVVPDAARGSLFAASQALQQIDQQALSACPGCLGAPLATPTLTSADVPDLLQRLVQPAAPASGHSGRSGHQGGSASSSSEEPTAAPSDDPTGTSTTENGNQAPSAPEVTVPPAPGTTHTPKGPLGSLGQGLGLNHHKPAGGHPGLGGLLGDVDASLSDSVGGVLGH